MPLYPDLALLRIWRLPVSGGHGLHVREWGAERGAPVLVLHGGPGSGAGALLWRVFDPQSWRVIVPDQRGAGASTPTGRVQANTTDDLLDDIAALRRHLRLTRWTLAGGSWGATLAMMAAAREPHSVQALLLRAPFLARPDDIASFFAGSPRGLNDLHAALHGGDAAAAAQDWWAWEHARMGLPAPQADLPALVQRYRVQSHYLVNSCFVRQPVLDRLQALADTPISIVHGTQDRVCPPESTHALLARWPRARVQWVAQAGHDAAHPALLDAWMHAIASTHAQLT